MAKTATLLMLLSLDKALMLVVFELTNSSVHLLDDEMILFIPSVVEGAHTEPMGLHSCVMSLSPCPYDIAFDTHHRPRIYESSPRYLPTADTPCRTIRSSGSEWLQLLRSVSS